MPMMSFARTEVQRIAQTARTTPARDRSVGRGPRMGRDAAKQPFEGERPPGPSDTVLPCWPCCAWPKGFALVECAGCKRQAHTPPGPVARTLNAGWTRRLSAMPWRECRYRLWSVHPGGSGSRRGTLTVDSMILSWKPSKVVNQSVAFSCPQRAPSIQGPPIGSFAGSFPKRGEIGSREPPLTGIRTLFSSWPPDPARRGFTF